MVAGPLNEEVSNQVVGGDTMNNKTHLAGSQERGMAWSTDMPSVLSSR